MSLMLKLISLNVPLYKWRDFAPEGSRGYLLSSLGDKHLDRIASTIISGLSHDEVIELVRREWDGLPPVVRMRVTQLANERYQRPSSNNQRKGIMKLDELLGGRILSVAQGPTVRDLRSIDGRLVSVQKKVRPNVAGAEQAFGAYVKPKDFDMWPPSRKRQWRNEAAAGRRGK